MPVNDFAQPVGDPTGWAPGARFEPVTLTGRTCRLEPLAKHHVDGLHRSLCLESPASVWTYMFGGPFAERATFAAYVEALVRQPATVALAIVLPDGTPAGIATWLRVDHAMGTAEVGHLTYASSLQRTTAATEAMYLMAAHAFDVVGVRRYEWKCDALNEPSRRAAVRLGFAFEGVFRQAVHYKGRNRDTAWFAITDAEWPTIRERLERWLDPANFDEDGQQRTPLRTEMRSADMSEDTQALTGQQIHDEGLEGWRKVLDRLVVRFETGDFRTGAALVSEIARVADEADHHPDVDLRYPHLTVSLKSHDVGAVTARDIRLARQISELAAAAGAHASAHAPDVLELAIDTPDHEKIMPFWAAILGYDAEDDEVTDSADRTPSLWFQRTDSQAPDRQRWHVDISVPHDVAQERIKAAIDAGGTLVDDGAAPAFWVLADADGNKACICTWESRD